MICVTSVRSLILRKHKLMIFLMVKIVLKLFIHYSSLQKSNQREAFRVGDNGILIPDEKNSNNYKLVCYEGDSTNPHINAIYKLENYDYNIHDGNLNILQTIIDRKKGRLNEKHTVRNNIPRIQWKDL